MGSPEGRSLTLKLRMFKNKYLNVYTYCNFCFILAPLKFWGWKRKIIKRQGFVFSAIQCSAEINCKCKVLEYNFAMILYLFFNTTLEIRFSHHL